MIYGLKYIFISLFILLSMQYCTHSVNIFTRLESPVLYRKWCSKIHIDHYNERSKMTHDGFQEKGLLDKVSNCERICLSQ